MREEVLEELGRPEQLTVLEAPCNPTLQKVKHLVPGKGNNGAKTRAAPWAHCHRAAGVPVMLWGPYLHLTAGRIPRDTHLKHVKTHIPPKDRHTYNAQKTHPQTHTHTPNIHTPRETLTAKHIHSKNIPSKTDTPLHTYPKHTDMGHTEMYTYPNKDVHAHPQNKRYAETYTHRNKKAKSHIHEYTYTHPDLQTQTSQTHTPK